jgi:hypothetical protein
VAGRPHPGLQRAGAIALIVVISVAGVIGLLVFFNSRDDAGISSSEPQGPGQVFPDQGNRHLGAGKRPDVRYASSPPTSGPHRPAAIRHDESVLTDDQILHAAEAGDVVLLYGSAQPPEGLAALARDVTGGPFDPSLAAGGQAVVLGRRPGARGVVAVAWRHLQRAPSASDPALREFAEYWLGRGAGA